MGSSRGGGTRTYMRGSQYFTTPIKILLSILVLVLFLRILQYLYLLQEVKSEGQVAFEWMITEHPASCFYSSPFVYWKITSCEQYSIGSRLGVIGRVDTTSDDGFFSKKRLIDHEIQYVKKIPASDDGWLLFLRAVAAQLRHDVQQSVLSSLNTTSGGFVLSLVFGTQADLDPDIRHSFETTGTLHILAVSGLHVSLVLGLLDRLLSLVSTGKVKGVGLWGLVTVYVLIIGFKPSVLRAWGMLSAALVARYLAHRQHTPFLALFLTSCLILIARPDWLAHPGFQLSVLATASIILLSRRFQSVNIGALFPEMSDTFDRSLEKKSKPSVLSTALQAWKSSLAVSVAAQMATMPLVLFHFGSTPAWGFLPGSVLTLAVGPVLSALFVMVVLIMPLQAVDFLEGQILLSVAVDVLSLAFISLLQVFARVEWGMITIS